MVALRSGSAILLLLSVLLLLSACQSGVYHTVEPGQNLFRISRAYGVDSSYLARINNISDPAQLRAGTRLYIPGASRQQSVAAPERATVPPSATRSPAPVARNAPVPATRSESAAAPRSPAVTTEKPVQPPVAASLPERKFLWPLQGRVVRQFNQTAQAGGGRGIEIAVRAGTDVSAVEAGKVIYSGDGVSGYGFLVILQHDHEMFSVYGFNQRNLVAQGAFVSRGEKIALSGTPPAGGEPRLHFEVRRGKEPVNPLLYLP